MPTGVDQASWGSGPTSVTRMYEVDRRDRVVPLPDVPQSAIGAPLPVVLADEHTAMVAYLLHVHDPTWDGTTIQMVSLETSAPCALVTFTGVHAMYLGMPNDEAFSGHPLASRGLRPYSASRIEGSSWIRRLERMNTVHEHHRPETYDALTHIVLAFHDSTFECVANSYSVETIAGPLSSVMAEMHQRVISR